MNVHEIFMAHRLKGLAVIFTVNNFEAHQFYIYEAQVNAPLNKKLCESIFKFSVKWERHC